MTRIIIALPPTHEEGTCRVLEFDEDKRYPVLSESDMFMGLAKGLQYDERDILTAEIVLAPEIVELGLNLESFWGSVFGIITECEGEKIIAAQVLGVRLVCNPGWPRAT